MDNGNTNLENYFSRFRQGIIGNNATFVCPTGQTKRILYADWTASGRMYEPIERFMMEEIYPFVANTHTETSFTGKKMTHAYHEALQIIKKHAGAGTNDVIISTASGMTGVLAKFQRILGFKIHENYRDNLKIAETDKPIVFITHMEHHSNQTSWLETICDVHIVEPDAEGLVCVENFEKAIELYPNRKIKIAAITSCSNVTGIVTPYHQIAALIHKYGGLCFVDFACSAPYIHMNMHPQKEDEKLDAIYFSPHKFLGGPGSTGILIFDKSLYHNRIPDHPGGGTVVWTNPWKVHRYVDDIEQREDGGTPAFLQTIRAAKCIELKEEMGVEQILAREHEQLDLLFSRLQSISGLHVLASTVKNRLGVVSFYIDGLHYNLGVQLLNDKFGIQVRGGCSCAGTYGHYLLQIESDISEKLMHKIVEGDISQRPGWIRLSIHPTMTNNEIIFIADCLKQLAENFKIWSADYTADEHMQFLFCPVH